MFDEGRRARYWKAERVCDVSKTALIMLKSPFWGRSVMPFRSCRGRSYRIDWRRAGFSSNSILADDHGIKRLAQADALPAFVLGLISGPRRYGVVTNSVVLRCDAHPKLRQID